MFETIGVIGIGRVGTALVNSLGSWRGTALVVWDSDDAKRREIQQLHPEISLEKADFKRCDLIILSVPDGAIRRVAGELARSNLVKLRAVIAHTSGVTPVEALAPVSARGGIPGSLHPVRSFPATSGVVRAFEGTYFGIDGNDTARRVLSRFVRRLGGRFFFMDSAHRTAYHLGLVFVANLSLALWMISTDILKTCDISPEVAEDIICDIQEEVLRNYRAEPSWKSLSGPLLRGDFQTVEAHVALLKGLAPESQRTIYRGLTEFLLNVLVRNDAITPKQFEKFSEIIRKLEDTRENPGG